MEFEVELTEEVVEFILSLPVKMQAKIQRTIELLQEFGYKLPEPHSKKLKTTSSIYELRTDSGVIFADYSIFIGKIKFM